MLGRLIAAVPFVGVAGTAVATLVDALLPGGDLGRDLLANALLWMVGVQGWMTGSGHLFFGAPIAASIGWPADTPWQWEVGLASLATGVLGVLASSFDRDFAVATIIAFSVFYLGAAVGHVRELVVAGNRSPGNWGPMLVFDVAAPLFLIALLVTVG
ncbi:MAG TPA: DUF6790 family protein [Baekduia sp.]|nr:DUF6790 family protein [Baekduia sp.]HET6508635.1 DUF6790 family protein [Baekduia sp.]